MSNRGEQNGIIEKEIMRKATIFQIGFFFTYNLSFLFINYFFGSPCRVLALDPFRLPVIGCHLASGLELGRKNELFIKAHRLVADYPHMFELFEKISSALVEFQKFLLLFSGLYLGLLLDATTLVWDKMIMPEDTFCESQILHLSKFPQVCQYFILLTAHSKGTQEDPNFLPSWLGFGHAYAIQDESDQAMAAYRTINRKFPG